MKRIIEERHRYEQFLKKSGLKVSKVRRAVFTEAMRSHGHFTAEKLAKTRITKKTGVSRATVHRALKELFEAGIIRKTAFGDKHHNYEHVYDEKPHHHAQCVRCHMFIEFPDLQEDKIYQPILEKQGFKVLGHEMHFYGICRQCQNTAKDS